MSKYFNIYIKSKEGISKEDIDNKMNLAVDWIRYDSNCYIIYSTSNIEKWMVRLKPLVEPGGRLFISELDIRNRNGWMTKDFWNWLKKER